MSDWTAVLERKSTSRFGHHTSCSVGAEIDSSKQVADIVEKEKRRILDETPAEGVPGARMARAHRVNANPVFGWRKLKGSRNIPGTRNHPRDVREAFPQLFLRRRRWWRQGLCDTPHMFVAMFPDLNRLHPDALKALITTQHGEVIATHEQLRSRESGIEHLKVLIARRRHMQFGRKSQKLPNAET